jgi:hypothetical protein
VTTPLPPNPLPLTREQRIVMHYHVLAGPFPGPNRAAIAAILAHRIVDLEDGAA